MFYYYFCHTMSVYFLCTLIMHVAGELSVLAHRIRHIRTSNTSNDCRDPEIAFRDVLEKHKQIIWYVLINNHAIKNIMKRMNVDKNLT